MTNIAGVLSAFLLINLYLIVSSFMVYKDDMIQPVFINLLFSLIIELLAAIFIMYCFAGVQ